MNWRIVFLLLFSNLLYACESLFSKYASLAETLGFQFATGLLGIALTLAAYAILWQQILKKVKLSTAYMFKGSSMVFILCFSYFIFQEPITICNIIGSTMLIIGIYLFAKE